MRARDLAEPYATVGADSPAIEAARLLARKRLPGLLVVDSDGRPYALLPADQLIRALVPVYVQEDPVLADVIDEPHADQLCRVLLGHRVADVLPVGPPFLVTAAPDSTAMEIAALMARKRSPLVAVVEQPDRTTYRLLGVVTAAHLLDRLLPAA